MPINFQTLFKLNRFTKKQIVTPTTDSTRNWDIADNNYLSDLRIAYYLLTKFEEMEI